MTDFWRSARKDDLFRIFLRSMIPAALFVLAWTNYCPADERGEVTFRTNADQSVTFYADGTFFAEYRPDCEGTPILWPICSSAGTLLSRSLPMIEQIDPSAETDPEKANIYRNAIAGKITEQKDHPHHRSFWFTHGEVNGSDFWALGKGTTIRPRETARLEKEGKNAVLVTKNDWIAENSSEPILTDIRTYRFGLIPDSEIRFIDLEVEITAAVDPVVIGDTKEGTFGFRVPGSVDQEAARRSKNWGGHIIDDEGRTDGQTWAKRSSWVDYTGPAPKRLTDAELSALGNVTPETLPLSEAGVTIMNHPSGFRYPSWYHVRTYGLFAVNPFGIHDFEPDNPEKGPVTLKKGENLAFRYRVLLHDGALKPETIQQYFDQYAGKAEKKELSRE